jgi:hypothetical protein
MNENAPTKTVLRHLQELDGRIVYLDAVLVTLILRCECIEARLADLAKKGTRPRHPRTVEDGQVGAGLGENA